LSEKYRGGSHGTWKHASFRHRADSKIDWRTGFDILDEKMAHIESIDQISTLPGFDDFARASVASRSPDGSALAVFAPFE
jgi:hypothetical protein